MERAAEGEAEWEARAGLWARVAVAATMEWEVAGMVVVVEEEEEARAAEAAAAM